ncbi:MAG: nucleoside-diphosphate kinase [Deltaproteobacteria bacterium]|nr:nucleoside-diphosphate kinase [Deltaproteobacteria bacterium]
MQQKTLAIIKPDGVKRGLVGEILTRIEKEGFRIVAMKMVRLSRAQAAAFYAVHKEKDFFEGLVEFMSSGPVVAAVLEAQDAITRYRALMGATDPEMAEAGTIRKALATDGRKNVVHGSDSPETAAKEIGFFFNAFELTI